MVIEKKDSSRGFIIAIVVFLLMFALGAAAVAQGSRMWAERLLLQQYDKGIGTQS